MERVQVIALAILVAALTLFGAGYVVDGSAAPPANGRLGGTLADGRPAVGISNRDPESRRRGGGSGQPAGRGRGSRRDGGEDDAAGSGVEVIAGMGRGRSGLGQSGSTRGGAIDDETLADRLAARAGTIPRAGGGGEALPHRPAREADGEDPPPDEQHHDAGGVLLSIPLKGSIDPEQGGGPTQADNVVVDGDAADFADTAQYTLPAGGHVDGAMGTIAFDVQPHWAGSDETNNSLLQIRDEHQWENNLQIVKNYDSLRFIIIDASGVETNVNIGIDGWQADESHRVTATWGDAQMALYVDGQPVGQATLANDLAFADTTPIHLGSDFPGSQYAGANARISNVRIYGRSLSADEIN